ncbi:MAG: type I pullulanase [Saprospiraceae bacterium]
MNAQQKSMDQYIPYDGNDLGLSYSPEKSSFVIWAPTATLVKIKLYGSGTGGSVAEEIRMFPNGKGTWKAEIIGDHKYKYYTIQANIGGKWLKEVPDPYAKAVGANGLRGMIIDLNDTHPVGWKNDKSPQLKSVSSSVIYELHVRDATISSNAKFRGKFLGLCEKGLKNTAGQSVGLDHIAALGVTHVHLLPVFDFASIDETDNRPKYNWGYDPQNYNSLEGSYASNPQDGSTRIKEFKTLIKTFHENGLRVVMDVVYNHVNNADEFSFQQLAPNYFFRQFPIGKLSNASACGNEVASERTMVRKFMLESLVYWTKEYHIDGFRFDLMGIHDIETMNLIAKTLREIKPDILLYGEGWTAGDSPLPVEKRAIKANAKELDGIAVFSDDLRDGIKGSVFEPTDRGFASGKPGMEESVKFGLVGGVEHPQVDMNKVNYSKKAYCTAPSQMISYAECHDNHTLWDRLQNSNPDDSEENKIRMFLLAETIVFCSQGIPFIHAGAEFCRTKVGVENSYDAPDEINKMDWERKPQYIQVFEYMKQLIAFRKGHPALYLNSSDQVKKQVEFLPESEDQFIAFSITGKPKGEPYKNMLIVLNASTENKTIMLPKGKWQVALDNLEWTKKEDKLSGKIETKPISASIYYQK